MQIGSGAVVMHAYLHELLKGSALKGLALVGGGITRHGGRLALWNLVPEEGWSGREVRGGMSRRWGTRYPSSSCLERRSPCRAGDAQQSLEPAHILSGSPLLPRGELAYCEDRPSSIGHWLFGRVARTCKS